MHFIWDFHIIHIYKKIIIYIQYKFFFQIVILKTKCFCHMFSSKVLKSCYKLLCIKLAYRVHH